MSRDIIRDIVEQAQIERNALIVKLFEKHGYSQEDLRNLICARKVHIKANKTLDKELFYVDGVELFGIEGRVEFDSKHGRCVYSYKEI